MITQPLLPPVQLFYNSFIDIIFSANAKGLHVCTIIHATHILVDANIKCSH
jgi:hypothetical protein